MRMAPVTGTSFRFQCAHCRKWQFTDAKTLADLDGEAYKAYYCGECTALTGEPRKAEET